MEVELQLPLVLGQQRAQCRLQRDIAFELAGELLDRRDLVERELAPAARSGRADETPLLQITEMVLGDAGVQVANVPDAE
jgi:hypothetical protein